MKRKTIISNNEISELCTFSLGGYRQKVLIEGKSSDLPVVVTLHGGPGTPIPFSVGCRGLFPAFTDNFIMVYWDQLGCGINNHIIDDTFSVDKFVQMTEELVLQVKCMYPNNKIMIFATSWGSILSAELLERNPYAVDAVIACGQIIKNVFICNEVKDALAKSKISKSKLKRIDNVTTDNFTGRDLQLISWALRKYTDAYQNKSGAKAPVGQIIKGLITSPDYTFKDLKAVMFNGYLKNSSLWKEIIKLDLTKQLSNVAIPYFILQGDTDIVASTKSVQELVGKCNNPNLSYKIIKNTGHFPGAEMMEFLLEILKEKSQLI